MADAAEQKTAAISSDRKEQKKAWLAEANAPRPEQPIVFSGRALVTPPPPWRGICYFSKKAHEILVLALEKGAAGLITYEVVVSCPADAHKTWSSGPIHEPDHGTLLRSLAGESTGAGSEYATLRFLNGTPCAYVGKRGGSRREKFQSVKAKIAFNLLAPADAQSVAADIRWFLVHQLVFTNPALRTQHRPTLLHGAEGLEALLAALRVKS